MLQKSNIPLKHIGNVLKSIVIQVDTGTKYKRTYDILFAMYRFTEFSLEISKYALSGTSVNGTFYLECLLKDLFTTFITFIDVLSIEPFLNSL